MLGLQRANIPGWLTVKLISKNSNLCDHNPQTLQTEGQTDRQTTCDRNTALCTEVHRVVKTQEIQLLSKVYHCSHWENLFHSFDQCSLAWLWFSRTLQQLILKSAMGWKYWRWVIIVERLVGAGDATCPTGVWFITNNTRLRLVQRSGRPGLAGEGTAWLGYCYCIPSFWTGWNGRVEPDGEEGDEIGITWIMM